MKTNFEDLLDWHTVKFVFKKGVPGDRYFYQNALDIPSVFGIPISLYPFDENTVWVTIFAHDKETAVDACNYVENHVRKNHHYIKF